MGQVLGKATMFKTVSDNPKYPVYRVVIELADGQKRVVPLWPKTDRDTGSLLLDRNGQPMWSGTYQVDDYQSQNAPPTQAPPAQAPPADEQDDLWI